MNPTTHTHARNTAPHATGTRTTGEQGSERAGTPPTDSQARTGAHSGRRAAA